MNDGLPYGAALSAEQRLARLEQRLGVAVPGAPALGAVLSGDPAEAGGAEWVTPTAWTGVAYSAFYVDYAAPYGPVKYMRDATGTVFVKGLYEITTGAATVVAFTLPAGFRPSQALIFSLQTSAGAQRFDLDSSGQLAQPGLPVGTWCSASFSFKAEA